MTETQERAPLNPFEAITPMFRATLRPPKRPPKPSDGAIAMAQKSYNGFATGEGDSAETQHVMVHRFATVEEAELAADELKRAGAYTEPESTVTVIHDPDGSGDRRVVAWRAGGKRGRKG